MANTRIVGFGPFRFWWERKWDLDADAQAEKEMRFVYGRRGLPSPRAHAASDESSQSTSQACYLKKIPTGFAISQILEAAAANYDILDFNPKFPVAVVIRSRRSDASGEYKIAGEDAGAAEIIVRMLPPNMAKVKVHAVAFDDDDKLPFSLPEANLIVIGGGIRNPVTRQLVREGLPESVATFSILDEGDPTENWVLMYQGKLYQSPWGTEEVAADRRAQEQPMHDHALLARFSNPMAEGAKVIVAGGVRRLGTYGAAVALQKLWGTDLAKGIGTRDYACIVRVDRLSASDPTIVSTEILNSGSIFLRTPEGSGGPPAK